jgi:hypothetical protein
VVYIFGRNRQKYRCGKLKLLTTRFRKRLYNALCADIVGKGTPP